MKKKVLIGMPDRLLDQVDLLAQYRSQTRSELIREALRLHLERAMSSGTIAQMRASVNGAEREPIHN